MTRLGSVLTLVVVCLASTLVFAGGPNIIGGPAMAGHPEFGHDGKPFIWNPARMPIQYRVDPGPMAATSTGATVINNAAGVQRVQSMTGVWQSVSTASLSFSNAGTLLAAAPGYSGGDVKTAVQYDALVGSCNSGAQSPVVFDADGGLMTELGLPNAVIGFAGPCALDATNGYIVSGMVVMNGKFQDGVSSPSAGNYEMSANEFDEAITHEIGHMIGLDHSQINLDLALNGPYPCDADRLAGMPLMFPVAVCQARKDAGLPTLAPDDKAWLSKLYPSASQVSSYGVISGYIYFGDGQSQFQGANVIARQVDDSSTSQDESRRVAVSVISGFLFTGNPGQSVTAVLPQQSENNIGGSLAGSRNPQLIGYYEIPVPPGTYTVEVESVYQGFDGGSSLGPLPAPVPIRAQAEFWNQDESAFDPPLKRDTITVHAGEKITDIDIILNQSLRRFDQYEDSSELLDAPASSPFEHETGRMA